MRIALLHPVYWPEVRRGAERLVHDYAAWLSGEGHDVTVVTTHRHATAAADEDGFRVVRAWRPPDRLFHRRGYDELLGTVPGQALALRGADVDVVHAFHPASAWAALRAGRRTPPLVLSLMGIPTRTWLVGRRYRMSMTLDAARDAAAVSVLSEAAVTPCRRYLLREPAVVAPGVRTADFEVQAEPATEEPTIVYAGSPSDPRKRLPLLLEAFGELRRRRPGARLLLAGRPEGHLALPEGVTQVPGDDTEDLARLLAGATLSVLPAIREAFGLVLVESMAAGTPVVAARSGGCPDIVGDERIGRLFEPDDRDDLVRALEEGLDLGADDATAALCREHARRWDWAAAGPRWLELAESAL